MTDNIKFSSGATCGSSAPPFQRMAWAGIRRIAMRYWYGNHKHENDNTVLSEANWLKAFHARDLEFFQERINHAIVHATDEQQGRFDPNPGGNWGAVGWCVDILSFVDEYDHDFYLAVVGLRPHPGKREKDCGCPRCAAGVTGKAEPPEPRGCTLEAARRPKPFSRYYED